MPGMDGMELQRQIKKIDSTMIVIIITAYATVDTAVEAMKEGALIIFLNPSIRISSLFWFVMR